MSLSKLKAVLSCLNQEQLLLGIEHLCDFQITNFLFQLEKYPSSLSTMQKHLLQQNKCIDLSKIISLTQYDRSGNEEDYRLGQSLLCQKKAGCLILAGGQGTRLGIDGPKGILPVSPIKQKSLFQMFCERVKAISKWAKQDLPVCIMTSPLNHRQTIDFFQAHSYFGLSSSQVSFFVQETLPFIDEMGHWLLEKPGKLAEGPDGNGHALKLFFKSGLWDLWRQEGIEYLNVILVDNALADPFDPELFGSMCRTGSDVCLKAVDRLSSDETMGMITECNKKVKVVEYSEIADSLTASFTLSHTGLFCVSMEFIRYLYQDLNIELPLHLAHKNANVLKLSAKNCSQEKKYIWKCERFIFDLFEYARLSKTLVYPRQTIYAPLKNASGDKSFETVKQALYSHYRDVYQSLTGSPASVKEFELDPEFYYSNEQLKQFLSELPLFDKQYITIS